MQLKSSPEDFIVREHSHLQLSTGQYRVYILRKRGCNTEDVLQDLSRMLKIPRKDIGYCGNKDKQAVTEQYITIRNGPSLIRTPEAYSLTYVGDCKEPLRLGEHERNFFVITVREVVRAPVYGAIKNYFGEQRFSMQNVDVGFALLQKNYRKAAELLNLTFTTDAIGALRSVPKHTLLLYVHAAQSKLWNELAATHEAKRMDLPLPGFGEDNSQYQHLFEKYGISDDAFVNRSLPELSLEGTARPLLQDVRDFSASEVENGVCTVCFSLGKGSYATETVKELFQGL